MIKGHVAREPIRGTAYQQSRSTRTGVPSQGESGLLHRPKSDHPACGNRSNPAQASEQAERTGRAPGAAAG